MSAVGDARKRAAEAATRTESAALATNGPNLGDDTSETANGPQIATQRVRELIALEVAAAEERDPGAIGRLNEAESGWEAICPCGHRVTWHHDTRGCEYFGTRPERRCQCLLTSDAATSRILREHADRALAEVESRINGLREAAMWAAEHNEDPDRAENFYLRELAYSHAVQIVRAARQEQS